MDKQRTVIGFPIVIIRKQGKSKLVASMVASTIMTCTLITFIPQLMPLWMAWATGSRP